MARQVEVLSWVAGGLVRSVSKAAVANARARHWADKFEELVLRVRRAGLLFFATIGGLILLSLAGRPIGLLLWLLALPLAVFGSLLSMFWPTRRFAKKRSQAGAAVAVRDSTLKWLDRSRVEIPLASRAAFDLVIQHVTKSQMLAGADDDLLAQELKRLVDQHLPRLVQSFLALPKGERAARSPELTEGLVCIAEELEALNQRLLASRADHFEIQRQFIAHRYPRRDSLAGL